MTKSVETITADIYVGLREGYTERTHSLDELKDFLQKYVNEVELCVTITPTTFIYVDWREEGAIVGLINYPRFPKTKEELEKTAEDIATQCKEEFKQNRISIKYQDRTVIIE